MLHQISSAFFRRQKSQSCSGCWPPKMLRSNACDPSCWPEVAQPTTAQREVDAAPCLSIPVTSKCRGADAVTSNQSVFLSPSTHLTCFDSLLPSPVEEVYVQQLINRCKAWCASAVELIFNQTLRADSWHGDFVEITMSNCLLCRGCLWDVFSLACSGKPNRSVCIEMWTTAEIQFVLAVVNIHDILSNVLASNSYPSCAAYSIAIK